MARRTVVIKKSMNLADIHKMHDILKKFKNENGQFNIIHSQTNSELHNCSMLMMMSFCGKDNVEILLKDNRVDERNIEYIKKCLEEI